jgi:hypothetical protein
MRLATGQGHISYMLSKDFERTLGGLVMNSQNIKAFVVQTLGCECPNQVFEYIDCQHNVILDNGIPLSVRINIGNRLLIYLLEVDDASFIQSNLSALIRLGKDERDSMGFNRFRLVIFSDDTDRIERAAHTIFENLVDKDEKVHLHILSKSEFPTL